MEALAKEWKIDIWAGGLKREVSEASFKSFERYMAGDAYNRKDELAIPPPPPVWYGIMNDEVFGDAWAFDPNFDFGMDALQPNLLGGEQS